MKAKLVRIAIAGLGEVTQVLHLPTLHKRHEHFTIVAVCDSSQTICEIVARQWGVANTYQNYKDMLARADIDAVLIATPNAFHARFLISALEAGKHVMVEKPYCVTEEEAEAIQVAEDKSGKVVQVGFMRNYSSALEAVKQKLPELGPVNHVRVHDVIGNNKAIIDQIAPICRANDYTHEQIRELDALNADQLKSAIGAKASDDTMLAYNILIGLASHDIAALMYLFGPPEHVSQAAMQSAGRFITATLAYLDFEVQLTIGIDNIPRYDTYIEVFGDNAVAKVAYDVAYVANMKQSLEWTSVTDDGLGVSATATQYDWSDSFDKEWMAFHASVTTGAAVVNSTQPARIGLKICRAIIAAFEN